jgi:hypothetical protein
MADISKKGNYRATKKLSEKGQEIVHKKVKRTGWNITSEQWLRKAHEILNETPPKGWETWEAYWLDKDGFYDVGLATWTRFYYRKQKIEASVFDAFCGVLEIDPALVSEDHVQVEKAILGNPPELFPFAGRKSACDNLKAWTKKDSECKLIILYGQPGMGKTALVRQLVNEVLNSFDCCIWLSLESAPSLSEFLLELNQELFSYFQEEKDSEFTGSVSDLISLISKKRCLLVLDDWEVLNRSFQDYGKDYREFLEQISMATHSSCFVIISRDNPEDIQLRAYRKTGRLSLAPLNYDEDRDLLYSNGLSGTEEELKKFLEIYDNPLVLFWISEIVKNTTGGNVSIFVRPSATILLPDLPNDPWQDEFNRLSKSQQIIIFSLLLWRSPVAYDQLLSETSGFMDQGSFLNALSSLCEESFIQRYESELSYCLRPLILKAATLYFTDKFFDQLMQISEENSLVKAEIILHQNLVKDDNDETLKTEILRRVIKPISIKLTDKLGGRKQAVEQLMKIKKILKEAQGNDRIGLRNVDLFLEHFPSVLGDF